MTKSIQYHGAVYRQAEPPFLVAPSLGEDSEEQLAVVAQIAADVRQQLDNAIFDQQQQLKLLTDGQALKDKLTAELAAVTAEIAQAEQDYPAAGEDVAYYQEVLEKLDQKDWNWLRGHSWLK